MEQDAPTEPNLETESATTTPETFNDTQSQPNDVAMNAPNGVGSAPNAGQKPLSRGIMIALFCLAALLLVAVAFGLGRCSNGKAEVEPDITATPQATAKSAETTASAMQEEAPAADVDDVMDMPELDSEGRDSDGMKLPVPEEGETLYLGMLDYSEAELSKIAFILTADGKQIRYITIFMKNLWGIIAQPTFRLLR